MTPRILFAVAAMAIGAPVDAQHPDLSGEWVLVADSAAARSSVAATGDAAFRRGDMGSGWRSPLTIRRHADSLIVQYPQFSAYDLQPPLRYVYALGGAESRNTVMIGHADMPERSRVSWSGDTLIITTALPAPADGASRVTTLRQALSLGQGGALAIETVREGTPPIRTVWRKR